MIPHPLIGKNIFQASYTLAGEGYISQYTPSGVYGLVVNENNEVNISLMIVKRI